MRKFWTDWIAIGFTAAGIILMALTVAWRINPAAGSVIPQFLKGNLAGEAVHLLLLITCMPVWFVAVFLIPDNYPACVVGMFLLQGLVYFLIGKGFLYASENSCGRKKTWHTEFRKYYDFITPPMRVQRSSIK